MEACLRGSWSMAKRLLAIKHQHGNHFLSPETLTQKSKRSIRALLGKLTLHSPQSELAVEGG
jgi:hypothetical protein